MTRVSVFSCFAAVHSESTKDLCVPLSRAPFFFKANTQDSAVLRAQGNRGEAKFSGVPFHQMPAFKNRPEVPTAKSRGRRATLIRVHRQKNFSGSRPALCKAARLGRGQLEATPCLAQQGLPKARRGTVKPRKQPSHTTRWDASPRSSPRIFGSLVSGAAMIKGCTLPPLCFLSFGIKQKGHCWK